MMRHALIVPALLFAASGLLACSPGGGAEGAPEYMDESDRELTEAEDFTRAYVAKLIEADWAGAYELTAPSYQSRMSPEGFASANEREFETWGVPASFEYFDFNGIGPDELGDDSGFPPDYPRVQRAARTVATLRTSKGGVDLWLNIGREEGSLGVIGFEMLPPD